MPETRLTHRRIAGFDGLRALAVILVVITHAGLLRQLEASPLFQLVHGKTGVRVFFVLSGYLITSLLLSEHRFSGQVSYGNFVARRALRIFPLYFLFLAVVTALYMANLWRTNPAGLPYACMSEQGVVEAGRHEVVEVHTKGWRIQTASDAVLRR